MFLQTIIPQREATWIEGGQFVNLVHADNGQTDIDDGFTGTLAYPLDSSEFEDGTLTTPNYSWHMNANSVFPHTETISDTPTLWYNSGANPPENFVHRLEIGTDLDASGQGISEEFSTYLMYRPNAGYWVALDQLDWEWAKGATWDDNAGIWNEWPGRGPSPTPADPPPIGPEWDGRLTTSGGME